jgi:hypothetical protein
MAIGDFSLATLAAPANPPVDLSSLKDSGSSALLKPASKPASALAGGSLMASSITFPSFNPVEFASRVLSGGPAALESAVSQLSALSKASPELARQALQALTRAAGGATAFARMVAAAGAPVFRAVSAMAAAFSLAQLSAALVIAGGILGLTAEGVNTGEQAHLDRAKRMLRPQTNPLDLPRTDHGRAPDSQMPRSSDSAAAPTQIDPASLPIVQQQTALADNGGASIRAASQQLTAANPLIHKANDAIKQFYYATSGGDAAWKAKTPQAQVQAVQQLRDELNQIVKSSNPSVAAVSSAAKSLQAIFGNPANAKFLAPNIADVIHNLKAHAADLGGMRDTIKKVVTSLDAWLPAAYRFTADRAQPLPAPPSVTYTPPGESAAKVRGGLLGAVNATTLKLSGGAPALPASLPTKQPALPTVSSTASATMPSFDWVDEMPVGAKHVADVWVNPTTREVSQTSHAGGANWVKIQLGSLSDEAPGALAVIPKKNMAQQLVGRLFGGGKKPDKNDLIAILFASSLVLQWKSQTQQDSAMKPLPTTAIRSWTPVSPLTTPDDRGSAVVKAWSSYATQIEDRLRTDGAANKVTVSGRTFGEEVNAYLDDKIGALKRDQVRLISAKTPQDKLNVLAAMAEFTMPRTSFRMEEGWASGIFPDVSINRPNATLNALIDEVNQQSRNDMRSIVRAPGLQVDSTAGKPENSTTQPRPVPQPSSEAVADPDALNKFVQSTKGPAAANLSQPAVAVAPATTNTAPNSALLDSKAALAKVARAVASERLDNPPRTDKFANVRFNLEMFLDPKQPRTYEVIAAAHARATHLFYAFRQVMTESDPLARSEITAAMLSIDNDVLKPLASMPIVQAGEPTPIPSNMPQPAPVGDPALVQP